MLTRTFRESPERVRGLWFEKWPHLGLQRERREWGGGGGQPVA